MGGAIAVTIRYADGREWRGSCWTNILPEGLFAPEFYHPDLAAPHVELWQRRLVVSRRADPELERIWGRHHLLAPREYGLIVVDFKKSVVVCHNGYSQAGTRHFFEERAKPSPLARALGGGLSDVNGRLTPAAFRALGIDVSLLPTKEKWEKRRGEGWRPRHREFEPDTFWDIEDALECTEATRARIHELGFVLSGKEERAWAEFLTPDEKEAR